MNHLQTYVCIGRIGKAFSTRGNQFYCQMFVDDFQDIKNLQSFYIKQNNVFVCLSGVFQQRGLRVLCTLGDSNELCISEGLVNQEMYVPRSCFAELEEGEYYVVDLIGAKALFQTETVGLVVDVPDYGASSMFLIESEEGKRCYVPFLTKHIEKIDLETKTIQFRDIEGFLDI